MLHDLFTNCADDYSLCVVHTGACPVVCNREVWVIDFCSMPTSVQTGVCSRHVTQFNSVVQNVAIAGFHTVRAWV